MRYSAFLGVLASLCVICVTSAADLVPTNSLWRLLKGTGEASTPVSQWRTAGFDDAAFSTAPAPFWYGDVRSGGTQLTDMRNNYRCIFLRHTFEIGNAADVTSLQLRAFVDDGFIAWINGVEVARVNMPGGEPTYLTFANNQPVDPAVFVDHPLPAPGGYLVTGTNVLAVQVFNTSLGSSDLGFDCLLNATIAENIPPTIADISPSPGTVSGVSSITVTFSEPVTGVHASDLIVGGGAAVSVIGSGATYTFTCSAPSQGTIDVNWSDTHGITDLATPANAFDETAPGASWQYTLVDATPPVVSNLHPPDGFTLSSLTQIEVTFSEPVLNVEANDLLINGSPATNVSFSAGKYFFEFPEPAPGSVNVVWAPGHGITDAATAPNAFAGGAWSYTLDPNLPTFDLVISEILAANVSTGGLADADGEQQDWIEIHNRGTNTVDLTNWSLSDDPALPGLWVFPARTLNPGHRLVVFASGKDRRPVLGQLHTNFKLSAGGEHLGLYAPQSPRVLASGHDSYPEQRNDVSYGLDSNGALRYFATPTPGGLNGTSTIVGVVEPVHVNVNRGHFDTPFTLVVSCPTPGTTIRYTTDGSEPTASSAIFPGSLIISQTTLFRAAGFKADHLPSRTVTHTYFFNLPEAIRSLPAVSIVTSSNHLWGPTGIMGIGPGYYNPTNHGLIWEKPTSVEWIEPEDHSGFQIDCGLRLQGSDYNRERSTPTSKFSFRLYFRGDYGPGRLEYPLFPLTTVDRFDGLVLRAGFNEQENPFIRDELHRRLSSDMGQIASHGNLAVVFVNGQYYSNPAEPWKLPVYNPCERIHEEFFQEHLGGTEEWDVTKPFWNAVVDGSWADFDAMFNYIKWSANASNPADYTTISQWLDLTNYVDYVILNTYAGMGDWPNNNWRAGKDTGPGGIWRFAVWDAEWGMGIYDRAVDINIFPFSGGGPQDSGMAGTSPIAWIYQGLKTSAEFRLLWADRVQKHFFHGGALTEQNITNRFEELRSQLSLMIPNMDTEILDWARNRQPIYFNHLNAEGLLSSVTAPSFSQHGGRMPVGFNLGMSAPAGAIYFTTNGSDPRVMFTGAMSASATAYTGAVPINSSITVKARARQGTTWSALTEAMFTHAALGTPLRVTEIMYNPPGGSLHEFIELLNTSASSVDLSGMYFGGISFTFLEGTTLPAGARLVLGSNTDTNAWQARYPGVITAGWFGGNLNNAGERIELFGADGRLITSVDYSDGAGWPEAADGGGSSLEVLDPNGDPDDPANWQASGSAHGTPGAANTTAPAPTVFINEVMAENVSAVNHSDTYPDWVELRNLGDSAVDISGWSLTDDGDERKFVFPAGTAIPANGYLVIWCDIAATPGLHTGFGLNNEGETLSLCDANTNRVDAMSFGLQMADLTVGRINGKWALNNPTPGALNTAAALAPVSSLTINEWMADPLPGEDDWLELHNKSASLPVSLHGIYLATSNDLHQLNALSFIPPLDHVQLRADRGVGPDHLDFNLSASGDRIALHDNTGGLIEQITYAAQTEGMSAGRLPDGAATIVNFPGSASPGAMNYVSTWTGPVINEVLVRNQSVEIGSRIVDFIELHNPGGSSFDLGGMSLSVDEPDPGQWVFPPNTVLAANAYLVIPCDGSSPASTNAASFNLSDSLNGESGGAWLFNSAGQLVNSVEFGPQIQDLPVGLSSGQWKLLAQATPGAANAVAAALGSPASLRLNEWMTDNGDGADWFEIYNPSSLPVDLNAISLSDDPSIAGADKFVPRPLSFIAAEGFVQWMADSSAGSGANHVNFALNNQGESLLIRRISGQNFVPVDAIAFGAQPERVSSGRIPDGGATVTGFPGSASPAASNYRLLTGVVVNEILTHTDPPFEDAIELHNPTASPLDVGGWFLSNNRDNFTKYRIPDGTIIPPGGFTVLYEQQFNDGSTNAFALNSARGDEVWLSKVDLNGDETYDRFVVENGAAFNGVSFGPVITTVGVDYAPLSSTTFGVSNPTSVAQFRTGTGAANTAPVIGPIVINEMLYNPPGGTNGSDEFIELFNNSAAPVPLFHPSHPTNTWNLGGGLEFTFPTDTTLPAGGFLLIVEFDPVNDPVRLAEFQTRYAIDPKVPVLGPFSGGLNNDADQVELLQPDTPQSGPPDAGFVPYVRVDRVNYSDDPPWPFGDVDGGGFSLQRAAPTLYGNEPINWFESAPTPGTANDPLLIDTDGDGIPDSAELAMGLDPDDPADANEDDDLDGMTNREEYLAGTDHEDPASRLWLTGELFGDELILTFDAVSNRTYSLLYQNEIGSSAWTKLTDIPAQPVNQTLTLTNTHSTSPVRVYRLVTPALQP